MRRIMFALLAASAIAAVSTSSAEASGGCGPYRHRTPWGACRAPGEWGWPPGGAYVYGYGPGWGWRHGYGWHGGWHHGWHHHWH